MLFTLESATMKEEASLITEQVRNLPDFLSLQLNQIGIVSPWADPISFLVLFGLVIFVCYLVDRIAQRVVAATISRLIKKTRTTWDDYLVARKIPQRIANMAPVLVLYISGGFWSKD